MWKLCIRPPRESASKAKAGREHSGCVGIWRECARHKNASCQYAELGVSRVRSERSGNEKGWGRSHWPTAIVRTLAFTPNEEQTIEGI